MAFFRKRPVVIEARLIDASSIYDVASWCGGIVDSVDCAEHGLEFWVNILTLEGIMEADLGDYVIKGVAGEFYPCKPDIFALTYEEVDEKRIEGLA